MGTTAQKLEYLQGTKDTLKAQLTTKGVTIPTNATFRQMANLVGNIQTGAEIETKIVELTDSTKVFTVSGFSFLPDCIMLFKCNNPGNYSNHIKSIIATPSEYRMAANTYICPRYPNEDPAIYLTTTFSNGSVTFSAGTNLNFREASYMAIAIKGFTPPPFPAPVS